MNSAWMAILLGALLGGSAGAPSRKGADNSGREFSQGSAETVSLAGGTALFAELDASVDTKKAKVGDPLTAHITEAVKVDGGTVLPKNARLVGHITQASARSKGDPGSSLGIQFDKAVLKKGQEIPLKITIQAMAAAPLHSYERGPDTGAMPAGTAAAQGSPMGASRPAAGTMPSAPGSANGSGSNTAGAPGEGVNDAGGGLDSSERLTSKSRGVIALPGLHLATDASSTKESSLITTSGKSVHLDSGIRLLLVSE